MDDILEEDFVPKVPHLADSHLQSPILSDERELFVNYWMDPTIPCPSHIRIQVNRIKNLKDRSITCPRIDSEVLYGHIYNTALTVNTKVHISEIFEQARTQAMIDLGSIVRGLSKEVPSLKDSLEYLYARMIEGEPTQELLNIGVAREMWDKIRLEIARCRAHPDLVPLTLTNIHLSIECKKWYVTSAFVIFKHDSQTWLMDYEQVLCISDTLISRQLALLYITLAKSNPNIYVPTEQCLLACYKWGDTLLELEGNKAYSLIKFWEPLTLGQLLSRVDTWSRKDVFLENMLSDYHNTRLNFAWAKHCTPQVPCEFCKLHIGYLSCIINPFLFSELFGIHRHWGHPTVELRDGCKKVQVHGKRVQNLDYAALDEITGQFVSYFISSYVKKHGHWPEVDLTHVPSDSELYTLASGGVEDISEFDDIIPLKDWALIDFKKNFEFDYSEDWINMIEDKAIAPYLSEWKRVYDPTLLGDKIPEGKSSRRVILECLRQKEINIQKICNTIMERNVPQDWFIILVHAKEREMKVEPRLFAMMVLEMRLYFCITEHNLAKRVMSYFPQQTMTLGELDLTHRLMALTKQTEGESPHLCININLDFEKWNLQWRYVSVRGIAKKIDQLFGTPGLYTYTHIFFEKCHIFSSHRFSIPEGYKTGMIYPPESDLHWLNHQGGFEGLRQKLWTLITVTLLITVSNKCKMRFIITGQGDNQIIKVYIPKIDTSVTNEEYLLRHDTLVSEQIDSILEEIVSLSAHIGLPVKRDETWISHRVFAYGKELLVDGAFLPGALKKIARVYFDVNEVYPTCESKLATIHTSAQAASQKGDNPLISYAISLIESYYSLLKDLMNTSFWGPPLRTCIKYKDNTDLLNFVRFCCLFPRALGGYPVSTLLSYLYRGHPDPVTEGLAYLKILSHELNLFKNALYILCTTPTFKKERDLTMLLQDPTAVNWPNPLLAANIIKNMLMDTVRENTNNRDVCMLFHLDWRGEDEIFTKCLADAQPFSPRILNDLYMKSPTGARMSFLSTFSNMRSTQIALGPTRRARAITLIRNSEKEWIKHMYSLRQKFLKKITLGPLPCLSLVAQKLRDLSWFPLKDNTIEGVTVPHPISQFQYIIHDEFCKISSPYSVLVYDPNLPGQHYHHPKPPWYTRGKFNPYLGSQTSEKKTGILIPLPRSTPSVKAAQRISQISSWAFSDDLSTQKILDTIISCRTNLNRETLLLSAGYVYGGSLTHRFNDPITSHEVLSNIRPNFLSHVTISSDTLGEYARGKYDVTLHFQGMFLMGGILLHFHAQAGSNWKHRQVLHAHVICQSCTKVIEDEPVKLPEVNLTYPSYEMCPLLYTNIDFPEFKSMIPLTAIISQTGLQHKSIRKLASNAAACMMESNHRVVLSSSFRGRSELISCPGTRGLDIQEFKGITFTSLIESLAWICILDRSDTVLDILSKSLQQVEDIYAVVLQKNPHSLWGHIRGHLALPENREWLKAEAGSYLPSSEAWKGGPTLDLALCRILTSRVNIGLNILKEGKKLPFIWFIVGGLTLKRLIICWSNMLILRNYLTGSIGRHQIRMCLRKRPTIDVTDSGLSEKLIRWASDYIIKDASIKDTVELLHINRLYYTTSHAEVIVRQSRDLNTESLDASPPSLPPFSTVHPLDDHHVIPWTHHIVFSDPAITTQKVNITRSLSLQQPPRSHPTRRDHLYRLHGLYSTAGYKYYDLIKSNLSKPPSHAMCLAEGAGGVCRLLLSAFGCDTVYYDSLVDPLEFAAHRFPGYMPPEVILSGRESSLLGANQSAEFGGDLLSLRTIHRIAEETIEKRDVITCDAEISGDPHPMIHSRLLANVLYLAHCHLSESGILIFKTFCKFPDALMIQLGMVLVWFEQVSISVPISSSHESYEVFLVGTSPRSRLFQPDLVLEDFSDVISNYLSNLEYLVTLRDSRIKMRPHQEAYMTHWRYLNHKMSLVYESNWQSSISTYLGPLSQECNIIREEVISMCQSVMELASLLMHEHFIGLGKIHIGCRVSMLGRELLNVTSSDRISLGGLAISWKNAYILADLLEHYPSDFIPHRNYFLTILGESQTIRAGRDELWITNEEPNEWLSRYGRPIHHIIGHLIWEETRPST